MIFAATLAAVALVPVVSGDRVVAYRCVADRGSECGVVVPTHLAPAVADAIRDGAGQRLTLRRERGMNVLVDSQDRGLKESLRVAAERFAAERRAADPLGHALGDLAMAERMLACARADVMLHDVPADHVAVAEAQVERLRAVVLELA